MNIPTDLPPIPDGHVYLGLGGEFDTMPNDGTFEGYAIRHKDPTDKWDFGKWLGHAIMTHFCAPSDSEVVKLNQKRKPPEPPEGAVLLGKGGTFETGGEPFAGWYFGIDKVWTSSARWDGDSEDSYYAAPADSEVVKLNQKDKRPAPTKKEYIIWCPARSEPTEKQPTLEAAETEVKRLAEKHPNVTYHICEIVASHAGEVICVIVASYVGEVTAKKIQ